MPAPAKASGPARRHAAAIASRPDLPRRGGPTMAKRGVTRGGGTRTPKATERNARCRVAASSCQAATAAATTRSAPTSAACLARSSAARWRITPLIRRGAGAARPSASHSDASPCAGSLGAAGRLGRSGPRAGALPIARKEGMRASPRRGPTALSAREGNARRATAETRDERARPSGTTGSAASSSHTAQGWPGRGGGGGRGAAQRRTIGVRCARPWLQAIRWPWQALAADRQDESAHCGLRPSWPAVFAAGPALFGAGNSSGCRFLSCCALVQLSTPHNGWLALPGLPTARKLRAGLRPRQSVASIHFRAAAGMTGAWGPASALKARHTHMAKQPHINSSRSGGRNDHRTRFC